MDKYGWNEIALAYMPVGSRVTCDPPPMDTDEDFLCLVADDVAAAAWLADRGFSQDGEPEFYTRNDNGGFRSFRFADVNVIITENVTFYDKFGTATALAKRFNLLNKQDRIALFQAVLYGVGEGDLA